MPIPPLDLQPNEIGFYFDTNRPVPAELLTQFISETARIARLKRHFGPKSTVEIRQIETGSVLVRLGIASGILGGVAGMGSFAIDLSERLGDPDSKIGQCVATMVVDHGVQTLTVKGDACEIEISREQVTAVRLLQQRRNHRSQLDTDDLVSARIKKILPFHADLPKGYRDNKVPIIPVWHVEQKSLIRLAGQFITTKKGSFRFKVLNGKTIKIAELPMSYNDLRIGEPTLIEATINRDDDEFGLAITAVVWLDDI